MIGILGLSQVQGPTEFFEFMESWDEAPEFPDAEPTALAQERASTDRGSVAAGATELVPTVLIRHRFPRPVPGSRGEGAPVPRFPVPRTCAPPRDSRALAAWRPARGPDLAGRSFTLTF